MIKRLFGMAVIVLTVYFGFHAKSAPATVSPAVGSINAAPADAFVDSLGINTHLQYRSGGYAYATMSAPNGNTVVSSIETLGVRHIRDGVSMAENGKSCAQIKALSAAGVNLDLVAHETQTATDFAAARGCIANDADWFAIEGENEGDLRPHAPNADYAFISDAFNLQRTMWNARTENAIPATTLVWGTTMGSNGGLHCVAWQKLAAFNGGSYPQYIDLNALHLYLYGWPEHKEYGRAGDACGPLAFGGIAYGMETAQSAGGAKKGVAVTETGYPNICCTIPQRHTYVDDSTQAKYTLREVLAMWQLGVKYEYIYELATDSETFGLTDQYLNPKPAYMALENLIRILKDPDYTTFRPTPLACSLELPLNANALLLAKHDGSYWLVFWLGVQSYDQTTNRPIVVPAKTLNVTFGAIPSIFKLYTFMAADGSVATSQPAVSPSLALTATDMPQILQIGAAAATPTLATPRRAVTP